MIYNNLLRCIILISLFITVISSTHFSFREKPIPPKNDPFYKPEPGFEDKKPGTILKSRVLPKNAMIGFSHNVKGVYQFLFRTTDALDKATATVTTLIVPVNADPNKLVSYQLVSDSASFDCALSYLLQKVTAYKELSHGIDVLFLDVLLSNGYYVNAPDYDGPGSFNGVGRNAGQGVLDSIRAVLSSGEQTQLEAAAQVQLWGYSGGAFATGWAAQIQPSYAPELKIIGAAMGGTPVDLKSIVKNINRKLTTGLIFSGIHGLSSQYSEFAAYIASILNPDKKQLFMDAKNVCLTALLKIFAFQNIEDYFTRPDFWSNPVVTKVMDANIMGKEGTPKIPIFMYHAKHDDIVPFKQVQDMYTTWCSYADNNTSIEFVEDGISDHAILMATGAGNAIKFLMDGFNKGVRTLGCSKRSTITSALTPSAFFVYKKLAYNALNAYLGRHID